MSFPEFKRDDITFGIDARYQCQNLRRRLEIMREFVFLAQKSLEDKDSVFSEYLGFFEAMLDDIYDKSGDLSASLACFDKYAA